MGPRATAAAFKCGSQATTISPPLRYPQKNLKGKKAKNTKLFNYLVLKNLQKSRKNILNVSGWKTPESRGGRCSRSCEEPGFLDEAWSTKGPVFGPVFNRGFAFQAPGKKKPSHPNR